MKQLLFYTLTCLSLLSFIACDSDIDNVNNKLTLADFITNKTIETGAVIACAGSDKDNKNEVMVFYYPKNGAKNFKLYQTPSINVKKDDFKNYNLVNINSEPVFNGALKRYRLNLDTEKWFIVLTELDGEIKISNPIRSKQIQKPTIWQDIVTITHPELGMPLFTWQDNFTQDNAIYFQVLSSKTNNLISGTYTHQNRFQFYKLDNVVLNITPNIPDKLVTKTNYNFTLMDISLDNWINLATLNKNILIP